MIYTACQSHEKFMFKHIALYRLKRVFLILLGDSAYPPASWIYFGKVWITLLSVVQGWFCKEKLGHLFFFMHKSISAGPRQESRRLLLKERLCVTEEIWGEYLSCLSIKSVWQQHKKCRLVYKVMIIVMESETRDNLVVYCRMTWSSKSGI